MTGVTLHDAARPTQANVLQPAAPDEPAARPRTGQVARTVLLAAVLAGCALLALRLPATPPGEPWHGSPAMFPALALVLAAGCALAVVWQRLRRPAPAAGPTAADDVPDDEVDATDSDPRRAGLGALLLLLYPAAITAVGFAPATLVFVVAGTRVCGLPWRRGLVVGGVLAATLHAVFVGLFHVGLPAPLILAWLGR